MVDKTKRAKEDPEASPCRQEAKEGIAMTTTITINWHGTNITVKRLGA